jgi:hypothetical protein
MDTYGVTVKRDDDLWVALINGIPEGVVGAADHEHFADLHADVLELVADLTDSDPSDLALNWRYELNGQDVPLELRRFLTWTRNCATFSTSVSGRERRRWRRWPMPDYRNV